MNLPLILFGLICISIGMVWMRTIIYDEAKTGILTLFGTRFSIKRID